MWGVGGSARIRHKRLAEFPVAVAGEMLRGLWMVGQDTTGQDTAENMWRGRGCMAVCGQAPTTECRSVVMNRRAGGFEIG